MKCVKDLVFSLTALSPGAAIPSVLTREKAVTAVAA